MAPQLSIGDFSRKTHLSVKALQHYNELALLSTAAVGGQSGYRYYEVHKVPQPLEKCSASKHAALRNAHARTNL